MVAPDASDSASTNDTVTVTGKPPLQVDFLWMIDHSSSMCQEQRALANAFASFIEKLQNYGRTSPDDPPFIDAQMAIVTVQQVPDSTEIKKIGQFVHKPATANPPSCIERTKQPCQEDKDCATPKCLKMYSFDESSSMCPAVGDTCITPPAMTNGQYWCTADNPQFGNNDNCSVNTQCQMRCNTDSDCYAAFEPNIPPTGKHRVYCNKSVAVPGCMFPPETEGCPAAETLPGVLKQSAPIKCTKANAATACGGGQCVYAGASDKEGTCYDAAGEVKKTQLDYFRCAASVGANQQKEASFEGGLRSLWQALDPNGINCPNGPGADCQYSQLVRPDALLVLVAISDDDDCSYTFDITADPKNAQQFPSEFQVSCQKYGDAAASNDDLNNGMCKHMQIKDKQAGKPQRTCPTDCLLLPAGSAERATCETAAAASIADLVANTPSLKSSLIAPVSDFVQRFKSLKDKPERVLFATITGDSTATKPKTGLTLAKTGLTLSEQKTLDRASFYQASLKNLAPMQAPYICSGPMGESGYGSRYRAVAKAMGASGFAYNMCDPNGLASTLQTLADDLVQRAVQLGQ